MNKKFIMMCSGKHNQNRVPGMFLKNVHTMLR